MNDELRMDLADCGSPERLLQAIFAHYPSLPKRVPVEDIAREVGISDFKVLEVDGFIGGLMADPDKNRGIILTKLGLQDKRKRFTVGHELGHFLIPTHGYQRQCRKEDLEQHRWDNNYQRQEAEANRFSAGLLMPKPLFTRDVDDLGSADVAHIRQLSDIYDVSMEAAGNRYVELSGDTCALIFSKDGVIRYARHSRDFPKLGIARGGLLPVRCLTHRHNLREPSPWADQFGGMWLEVESDKRIPNVLEQSMAQANGFKVTLLYIDESNQDDAEENESFENRWRFGFR